MKQKVMSDKRQVSGIRYHVSRFMRPALTFITKFQLAGLLVIFSLPALACSFTPRPYQINNEVRLAAYGYERQTRGPADDLVLDFQRDEPRLKFEGQHENGGRTVWLYRLGVNEFFTLRPPEATFLYLQSISYSDNYQTATVKVFRGNGAGYTGWQLTLRLDNSQHWMVTDDVEIKPEDAK